VLRLVCPEGKVIAAHAELDRIAKRGPANHFNAGALAEAHFKQTAAQIRIAAHIDYTAAAPDPQLVKWTRSHRPAVIAAGKVTSFFHANSWTPP
jgi:hypothetical protein